MRQRAFPKMLPCFIVGVVYWSVPGCGLPFLWRVFFPDMNIKIENAWIWFAFFYPIFHAWLAENKVSESHSLDHALVPSWKARLPCCCFPLFCILASYLSCSRSQVGIDLGFPVIIFKYHPKWHCILFGANFSRRLQGISPRFLFFECLFFFNDAGGTPPAEEAVNGKTASWRDFFPKGHRGNLFNQPIYDPFFGQTNRNSGYFFLE